ncbi:hypothetical protein [Acidovorax sp. Leaf78]|uniref:hypothetical protein n=1 Tax=Acidovorax sp. Leaf78 TaxID=1736237 RepID=UPI000AFFAA52|nr:hypothetical protein [Acidovorax sp. Leaf78]
MADELTLQEQVNLLQEQMEFQQERASQTIALLESVNALLLAAVRQSENKIEIMNEYIAFCDIADHGPAHAARSDYEKEFVLMVRQATVNNVMQGDEPGQSGPLN